jgi:A/G-specific adenine glycosylase
VLVSELMLQQTPVSRVLPVYDQWLRTWPTPAALAAATTGEAVRAWGRLGYPRRALRLHAAAGAIVERHGGEVPERYDQLVALPGVGDYTAAAVASFAYRSRHVVLDTNVRRVLTRVLRGVEVPAPAVTRSERDLAAALLPDDGPTAAAWAVATMELGALVCVARAPRCGACPVADLCAWRRAGCPPNEGPARRRQAYDGTDRQCRGRLLGVLRESVGSVHRSRLEAAWAPADQRERCLRWLVDDGLVVPVPPDRYALP